MNLFVYGELCKLRVLREVLGRIPLAHVAILPDHARRPGSSGFFEAFPCSGARVPGLLLEQLSAAELERLDAFEDVAGGRYQRARVRVRTLGAPPRDVEAHAYLKDGEGARDRRRASEGSR